MANRYVLERYLSKLLKGDRAGCRGIIEETLKSGTPANTVYMDVIWPIMIEVDRLYRHDIIDSAQEAFATRINRTIVDQLQNKLPRRAERAQKIIVCSTSSEQTLLATNGARPMFRERQMNSLRSLIVVTLGVLGGMCRHMIAQDVPSRASVLSIKASAPEIKTKVLGRLPAEVTVYARAIRDLPAKEGEWTGCWRWAYVVRKDDRAFVVIDGKPQPKVKSIVKDSFGWSRDGRHYRYVARDGGKEFFVIDGRFEGRFGRVVQESFQRSKDGGHYAYVAKTDGKYRVVLNGKAGPAYDGVAEREAGEGGAMWDGEEEDLVADGKKSDMTFLRAVFTRNGKGFAHTGRNGKSHFMVVNGVRSPAYESVGAPIVSEDRERIAYAAESQGRQFVVANGKPGPKWDRAERPAWMVKGKGLAYVVSRKLGEGQYESQVVADGKTGPVFEEINNLTVSPDGRRLAYLGKKKDKWYVQVDGKTFGGYGGRPGGCGHGVFVERNPAFTPDSARCVWVGRGIEETGEDRKLYEFLVVDGVAGPRYAAVRRVQFGPRGKTIVYEAIRDDGKVFMVISGVARGPYDGNGGTNVPDAWGEEGTVDLSGPAFVFGPAGKRVAYVARKKGKAFVVVDGKTGPSLKDVHFPLFSRDSKRIVYWAEDGKSEFLVLDARKGVKHGGGVFLSIFPFFSVDGRHVVYVLAAWEGDGQRPRVWLDG